MITTLKNIAGLGGLLLLAFSPPTLYAQLSPHPQGEAMVGEFNPPPTVPQDRTPALYICKGAHEVAPGERLFVDPEGKVYNGRRKQVGYLTSTDGNQLDAIPANGDYQIRGTDGSVLGQNRLGMGFESICSLETSAGKVQ
jgi:hypothetical protein